MRLPTYFIPSSDRPSRSEEAHDHSASVHVVDVFRISEVADRFTEWIVTVDALGALQAFQADERVQFPQTLQTELAFQELSSSIAGRVLHLATAACAEANSSHPIARAIVECAAERKIPASSPEQCLAVHGKGLKATWKGKPIWIGNVQLFEGTDIPESIVKSVHDLETAGQTTMVVRLGERFIGTLGVADTVRANSKKALAVLRAMGMRKMIMLSGDNVRVARAIAAEVGLDEARAQLLPDHKVSALRELARNGHVAMVGDGVNDAPALAAASVGVAMGGAGSDVAVETADAVLMADDLSRLPFAIKLSRKASAIVRQNLAISLGVSALLVLASVFGWVRISEAVVFHEGSTVLVVMNGLRLLGFRG